ncbi:MAG TPA: PLP-dependent aminotransferase family protein [Gammaproteobacteria bacterium]
MKLYQQVASQVRDLVDRGVYGPGAKLPSVRKLSGQLEVSISTVLQAYARLEDLGLVEAVPQSGYYVRRVPRAVPAPPAISCPSTRPTEVGVSELALEMLQAGERPGIVQFGSALPCLDFPAVQQLPQLYARLARTRRDEIGRYEIPPGNPALRLQLARRAVDAGISVAPDCLVVTSGCQEALMLALRAVGRSGDTIAVESPGYYGVLQCIESLGMRALEIPTDPLDGISLDALRLALEQWPIRAVMLTPQFSNPLGYLMPDASKQALLALLAEHDLPLIEDDINGELGFADHRSRAIKSWDSDGRVLYCSSVSKTLEPGLRIGWIVPGRYYHAVEHLKVVASMATATLPQMVVAEFLATGGYDRHLRTLRAAYRERRDRLYELLAEHFPAATRITRPEGGYLAWLELDRRVDTLQLFHDALALGIAIAPGPLFSAVGKYPNFMRINYSMPWTQDRVLGLARLGELVAQQLEQFAPGVAHG